MRSLPLVFSALISTLLFTGLAQGEWQLMPGPTGVQVNVLYKAGTTLYAGTDSKGVYRSDDGGANWRAANSSIEETSVYDLIFAQGGLLAAVANSCGDIDVFRSTDSGTTWTATGFNRLVSSFALKDNAIYAVASDFNSSIFRSTNGGLSWQQVPSPIQEGNEIFVSGNAILVAEYNFIWRSTDNGGSWDVAEQFALSGVKSFSESGGRILGAGVGVLYRSTDNGAHWQFSPFAGGALSLSSVGNTVYLGGGNKVSKSTDSGLSWTDVSNNLGKGSIEALLYDGTNVYAGTPNDTAGVYITSNGGASWSPSYIGLPTAQTIRALAAMGNYIYAGMQGDGIYRSGDNGTSWFKTGLNNPALSQLVLSFCVKGSTLFAGASDGLFRSTDDGVTFETVVNGFPTGGKIFIPSITVSGGYIVVAASINYTSSSINAIFYSSDDGASWHQSTFPAESVFMSSVASDGSNRVYAGSYGQSFSTTGLYKSVDKGVTWTSMTFSINADIDLLAVKGNNVLAANLFSAFYSTDGGNIFFGSNFPSGGIDTYTLKDNFIFGGDGAGVYYSTNQGANWTNGNQGFPACPKPAVEASCQNGAYLFAGTFQNGIWRIPLSEFGVTGVIAEGAGHHDGYSLSQNMPNPAAPLTSIEFAVPRSENAILQVFDVTGREVRTLLSEEVAAGIHRCTWNTSEVANGVYYYRLRAGDFVETKQMVVLK